MLIPADRVLEALSIAFANLRAQMSDADTDGSIGQAINNALCLLQNRERGSVELIHRQFDELLQTLSGIESQIGTCDKQAETAISSIRQMVNTAGKHQRLDYLEQTWREVLAETQALVTRFNTNNLLPEANKTEIMRRLVSWEANDLLRQVEPPKTETKQGRSADINQETLTVYLQDRFDDPDLRVTAVSPLAGGFGKQTYIFETAGKSLAGSFVMRRDLGTDVSVNNDCHQIQKEYPVIKAAHERGFPAPDALWLDTEHKLLPGGHFIVMRRSPGKIGGSFFGAQSQIPGDLADTLADVMAKLHTLPPLTELGNLTESIQSELWSLSQGDCTERYIRNWYDFYLNAEHTPSPSIASLYGWLLDNIPKRDGRPALVHGDFGFHNFLFHDDKLSAVLDWEFAHIGDPAEELGYVSITVGKALDWERLMSRYIAAGGSPVDHKTLRFFEVWAYVRNASAANIHSTCFSTGRFDDLKLTFLPHAHVPQFIRGAQALIDAD